MKKRGEIKVKSNQRYSRSSLMMHELNLSRPKLAQVTIFIMIAIVIVAGIIVYFLWVEPSYVQKKGARLSGFDGCVQDAIEAELAVIGEKAGYVESEFTYLYQGKEIGYLCYTNLYYKPCIMQEPFLKQHVEANLKMAIAGKINECYAGSIAELRGKGHDIQSGTIRFEVLLEPEQVVIQIDAPTSVSGQRFTNFDSKIPNPIYNMLMIATSILQYETKYGDSDTSSIMFLYPNLIIDKIKRSDGTTIYILTDKQSGTKFQFASRSFALPAGYGVGSGLVGV